MGEAGAMAMPRLFFRPDGLDCFLYDSLRRQGSKLGLRPVPHLGAKLLKTLVGAFVRDGASLLRDEMAQSLCPVKTSAALRADVAASDLLSACERLLWRPNAYEPASNTVYFFLKVLEMMWPDARDRLADVLFELPPQDLLRNHAELFHAMVRACGCKLGRYAAWAVPSLEDLEETCSTWEGASVMWHFALVGALPPGLVCAASAPEVFFKRLNFSGRSAEAGEVWHVSLMLPLTGRLRPG